MASPGFKESSMIRQNHARAACPQEHSTRKHRPACRTSDHSESAALKTRASVFAALGDETRLSVLTRLANGRAQSISRLTADTNLTRQAVTKHLRVLAGAGVVRCVRVGRESQFALEPKPINDVRGYLERVSKQWDDALARLKSLVED
jgi:DNA-binding transcriptional ArsR family regulator